MNQFVPVAVFILGLLFGSASGFFAGQASVYSKIMTNTETLVAPHLMLESEKHATH